LLINGTRSIEDVALAFQPPEFSGIGRIAEVLVEAVFMEVTQVVTSHSLKGESFEDIQELIDAAISFRARPEVVAIDRGFLEAKEMNFWRSLIKYFGEEYSARLDTALRAEEWESVRPESTEIEILRKVSGSRTTSFALNGRTYDVSPPFLILLESIFEYLEMGQKMTPVIGDLVVAIFESIRVFASGISKGLLQRELAVTPKTLALAASGLHFYIRLAPLIEYNLMRAKARKDEVEKHSSEAMTELYASYDETVKRIENMRKNASETDRTVQDLVRLRHRRRELESRAKWAP
jgi:hypothetical protein